MGETSENQAPVTNSEKPKRQPSIRSLKRKFSADEEEAPLENNNRGLRRSLRRGSSFTFLTPGPQWDFSLKRKRREKDDSDAVSLCSFDFKTDLCHSWRLCSVPVWCPGVFNLRLPNPVELGPVGSIDSPLSKVPIQEPSTKRVRPLGRVTSLANLISPVKNGAVRRFGQTIQASFRGDGKSPGVPQKPCSKAAAPTPPKRRNSTLWSETLDVHQKGTFSTKEIKRQEAIFELSRGEQDLIEDLQLARKAYHDPMLKLSIMSEEELTHIFGNLDAYIPLHEDLLAQLSKATGPDGTVGQIGQIVVNWLPRLNAYKDYCSNQLAAKALLDQKKQDRRVQDFLQRCLESPFSRKLDLWSFLDIPRSRLVKYPLLLKEILKHTPPEHQDAAGLEEAITIIQGVLSDINMKKGESECQYYIDKLEYLDDRQRDPRIEQCKSLLCHGELRNKSGTKLHVFLFTELLVLTRPVTRNERHCFQVYRQPIPVQDLVLEDLQDGDVRMGGSFRGAFSNADKAKNIFRVRSQDPSQAQSHTLQVNDVFHKQQWLNCLRSAISVHRPLSEPSTPTPPGSDARSKRRPSSVSAIVHMEETDENCPQPTSQSAPSSPCSSTTPSPTTTPPSSSSSSTTSTSSSTSPSPTSHKTKKDKKSLYSLGKRKETMV